MAVAYLALNAVLYVALGLWCALDPATTSRFVGLQPTGPAGHTEWMAVYGGLELGLGVFFALAAARPGLRRAGVLFGVCLYAGLATLRSVAVLQVAPAEGLAALGHARGLWATELLLLALGLLALRRTPRPGTP